ncbi:hypothetical protein [Aeromonas caviae]
MSLITLSIYGLHPFINGSGCDFQSQSIGDQYERYATCRFGVISVIEKDKVNNKKVAFQGLYGVTGGRTLVFIYSFASNENSVHAVSDDYLIQSRYFYISNNVVADKMDWVMVKSPVYQIYQSKRIGRLGWWL